MYYSVANPGGGGAGGLGPPPRNFEVGPPFPCGILHTPLLQSAVTTELCKSDKKIYLLTHYLIKFHGIAGHDEK